MTNELLPDVGVPIRLRPAGKNHRKPTQAKETFCGRKARGALPPDEDERLCVDCKRALEVIAGSKKKRTYRTGCKDPGKPARLGTMYAGALRPRERLNRKKARKRARESRKANR